MTWITFKGILKVLQEDNKIPIRELLNVSSISPILRPILITEFIKFHMNKGINKFLGFLGGNLGNIPVLIVIAEFCGVLHEASIFAYSFPHVNNLFLGFWGLWRGPDLVGKQKIHYLSNKTPPLRDFLLESISFLGVVGKQKFQKYPTGIRKNSENFCKIILKYFITTFEVVLY